MRLAVSALALVLVGHVWASEPPLRFAIAQSWSMPLVQIENGEAQGGILYDMMISLARQVGSPAEFYVIPRKRLQAAMENGHIDVRCYASQSWLPNLSGDYIWSVPVLEQRDILVAQASDDAPVDLSKLHDERIGTVLGFLYPALEKSFASGALLRDDARNQQQVLEKLLAHRYRYAASNALSVNWLNHQLPADKQLHEVAEIQNLQLGCYVRDDPALPVQRVLRTLLRMKISGEIDDLVRRYNGLSVGSAK